MMANIGTQSAIFISIFGCRPNRRRLIRMKITVYTRRSIVKQKTNKEHLMDSSKN